MPHLLSLVEWREREGGREGGREKERARRERRERERGREGEGEMMHTIDVVSSRVD